MDVITPLVRTPMTAGRHEGAMDPADFCAQMLSAIHSGTDEVYVGRAKLLPWLLRIAPEQVRRRMMNL